MEEDISKLYKSNFLLQFHSMEGDIDIMDGLQQTKTMLYSINKLVSNPSVLFVIVK